MELGTSRFWDVTGVSVVLTTSEWESSAGSSGSHGRGEDIGLGDRSAPLGLTIREIDVLRLIGDGYSVSGIAAVLSYSESTIKKVLHSAMRHMGAKNRTHAVAIAVRAKVI